MGEISEGRNDIDSSVRITLQGVGCVAIGGLVIALF